MRCFRLQIALPPTSGPWPQPGVRRQVVSSCMRPVFAANSLARKQGGDAPRKYRVLLYLEHLEQENVWSASSDVQPCCLSRRIIARAIVAHSIGSRVGKELDAGVAPGVFHPTISLLRTHCCEPGTFPAELSA